MTRADRLAVERALSKHAAHDFEALRTRALITLALGSALRMQELLNLDVEQIEEHRGIRIAPYLRNEQAKGGQGGAFTIPPKARTALRLYLAEGRRRQWLDDGPLFIAYRRAQHPRMGPRGAQHAWKRVQAAAGIREPYRFHDLRHASLTRYASTVNGDAFKVAQFGRLADIRTAMRYVHGSVDTMARMAERAEAADSD